MVQLYFQVMRPLISSLILAGALLVECGSAGANCPVTSCYYQEEIVGRWDLIGDLRTDGAFDYYPISDPELKFSVFMSSDPRNPVYPNSKIFQAYEGDVLMEEGVYSFSCRQLHVSPSMTRYGFFDSQHLGGSCVQLLEGDLRPHGIPYSCESTCMVLADDPPNDYIAYYILERRAETVVATERSSWSAVKALY